MTEVEAIAMLPLLLWVGKLEALWTKAASDNKLARELLPIDHPGNVIGGIPESLTWRPDAADYRYL